MENSFLKIERSSMGVSLGIATTLDLMLQITGSTAGVTVAASAAALNTSNADLDTAAELAYIDNAPVSLSRNVLNNLALNAVVVGAGGSAYTNNGQSAFSMVVGDGDLG
jgi:hypothetical protein